MRTCIMVLIMGIAFSLSCTAQKDIDMQNGEEAVKTALRTFAKSGDNQDAATLDNLLDNNFRVVMNQLFGSTGVVVMTKEIYLEKIRNKEFGGDPRKVEIEELEIVGKTAQAKVTLTGSEMTFVSLIQLIQDQSGNWKLISDTPTVI